MLNSLLIILSLYCCSISATYHRSAPCAALLLLLRMSTMACRLSLCAAVVLVLFFVAGADEWCAVPMNMLLSAVLMYIKTVSMCCYVAQVCKRGGRREWLVRCMSECAATCRAQHLECQVVLPRGSGVQDASRACSLLV